MTSLVFKTSGSANPSGGFDSHPPPPVSIQGFGLLDPGDQCFELACVYCHAVEAVQGRTVCVCRTARSRRRRASSRRRDIDGTGPRLEKMAKFYRRPLRSFGDLLLNRTRVAGKE